MKPLLSIAIPTYNRAEYLDKTLENITSQITPEVEIVISDDGSSDNTEFVVKNWQEKFPEQIVYYKKYQNERFDKNIITAVEKSSGKYCWFMSDDDKLASGAIARVLSEIVSTKENRFFILNYSRFENSTQKISIEKMIEFESKTFTLNEFMGLKSPNSFFNFMGMNLIYMSIFIFPRESWLRHIDICKKYIGINFIHCFVFINMLAKEKMNVAYIDRPHVLYLAGNIRAWGNNIWKDFHTKFLDEANSVGVPQKIINKIRYKYYSDRFKIQVKAVMKKIKIWK